MACTLTSVPQRGKVFRVVAGSKATMPGNGTRREGQCRRGTMHCNGRHAPIHCNQGTEQTLKHACHESIAASMADEAMVL